jgi:excisionase family DNA binding protein
MATPVASLSEGPEYMNDHGVINDHRMMTVKEVADYLRIATSTVYRLTERGALPALKVGSGWRFNNRMIDKWRFNIEEGRRIK